MNIMINNYCNLRCSYCFARGVMSNAEKDDIFSSKTDMSKEDFHWILSFMERSQADSLRIIGGEPTLHPHFPEFLIEGVTRPFIRKILVFSNGLFSDKVLHTLSACSFEKKLAILFNYNSPKVIGEERNNLFLKNVAYLSKRPINITLGINIYDPEQDYKYIINAAKKFGVTIIRWTVVVPPEKKTTSLAVAEYFSQFVPIVTRFVEDCVTAGLSPRPDCNNIPVCMYGDDVLRLFALICPDTLKSSVCSPTIDIKPDLTAIRCFGMSHLPVDLKKFQTLADLKNYFQTYIDKPLDGKPLFEACKKCASFQAKGKACGCLAFGRYVENGN